MKTRAVSLLFACIVLVTTSACGLNPNEVTESSASYDVAIGDLAVTLYDAGDGGTDALLEGPVTDIGGCFGVTDSGGTPWVVVLDNREFSSSDLGKGKVTMDLGTVVKVGGGEAGEDISTLDGIFLPEACIDKDNYWLANGLPSVKE